ncbi:hypothetical protein N9H93_01145 [Rhizobiaceae bacterium]|nr:hypothetical protein [Rhizobiaceae bacterium]
MRSLATALARLTTAVMLAFAVVATSLGVPSFTATALAQSAEPGKRKSLFRALFGREKAKRKAVRTRTDKRQPKRVRKTKPKAVVKKRRAAPRKSQPKARAKAATVRAPVAAAAAVSSAAGAGSEAATVPVAPEEKRVILVAGDFYASGLADGLEEALADMANIEIVDRSNGLSGFIRDDVVDWPATIGKLVEEVKPDHVLFMAGSNDRQLLRLNGRSFDKREPEWDAEYLKRIGAMGEALKATGKPFTWLGLPSVRFSSMSRDFVVFNEWYGKAAALSPLGKFVDIWDGFADAQGVYSRSGPDINGQITLLRRKDGINLTNAGKRRLAFYVEADLRKAMVSEPVLAPGLSEFDGLAGTVAGTGAQSTDPRDTGRTAVVSLDDPAADGGEVLAGETLRVTVPAGEGAAIPALGAPPAATRREGRVDDFRWPPVLPGPPAAADTDVAAGPAASVNR